MKKHFLINIRPQMITTSKGLDSYDPLKRLLECLTNYTLKRCQCVNFLMPRNNATKVCPLTKTVLREKLKRNPCDGSYEEIFCDCLPSCTSLKYKTEVSFDNYPYKRINDAMRFITDTKYGNSFQGFIATVNNFLLQRPTYSDYIFLQEGSVHHL